MSDEMLLCVVPCMKAIVLESGQRYYLSDRDSVDFVAQAVVPTVTAFFVRAPGPWRMVGSANWES